MILSKKDLGRLIKKARKIKAEKTGRKYTQQMLANDLGISRGYVGDFENGRTYPNYVLLNQIANACGVPLSFFEGAETETELTVAESFAEYNSDTLVKIPVVGVIRAGEPIRAEQNIIDYEYLPADMVKSGEYFGLKVTGDSMDNAQISDGNVLIVREQPEVENGDIAVVIVDGENATVKRFYKTDTMVTLMPDSSNKEHQPRFIDTTKEDVKVLGKVVKVVINL